MQVKCISVNGATLSEEFRLMGHNATTKFNLELNSTLIVYGICYWRKVIFYLTKDKTNLPNWYPSELFVVVDSRIPFDWEFMTFYEKGRVCCSGRF